MAKAYGDYIPASGSSDRGCDEADYERALHLELLAMGIEHECNGLRNCGMQAHVTKARADKPRF